ncbi:MAG: glycosyltransferase family 2 protein [Solirubrobacteraceae bacterium]|jgi:GT2 family glycosyltransferase
MSDRAPIDPSTPVDASDVTFVILSWNGRSFLEVVLPSIFAQSAQGFAVYVIDDASTDDSREYVEREWPQVKFIAHSDNVGVTRNMNRGISSATTTYVALLNNDLELDPDWLVVMRGALEAHPEAAAADCKMLDYYQRDRLDGAGDELTSYMLPGRRGNGELDRGQYDEPGEVFSVCCGAALFRASAFEEVGPFDADLFAYYEDVDWGFRARLLGYCARYVPAAVAFHMGSATTSREPGRWSHLFPRNQVYVVIKDLPARLAFRYWPRILVGELYWLGTDMRRGLGLKHLKGWWQALFMTSLALRKRREIQARRRVSVEALEAALAPRPGLRESVLARLFRRRGLR